MGACKFKTSQVKGIVQHALAGAEPALLFVHDNGVYLMSNGERTKSETDSGQFVAYAKGCDPKTDADFYEESRFLVGGDDFGETIEISNKWLKACEQFEELVINVGASDMTISFGKPKRK